MGDRGWGVSRVSGVMAAGVGVVGARGERRPRRRERGVLVSRFCDRWRREARRRRADIPHLRFSAPCSRRIACQPLPVSIRLGLSSSGLHLCSGLLLSFVGYHFLGFWVLGSLLSFTAHTHTHIHTSAFSLYPVQPLSMFLSLLTNVTYATPRRPCLSNLMPAYDSPFAQETFMTLRYERCSRSGARKIGIGRLVDQR